jgi:hypothetical protein
MPHSLTPADLLYPRGELQPKMFPDRAAGANAEDALEEWLDQADLLIVGVAASRQNAAARAYCYARAFRAMAMKIGALPDSSSDSGVPMNVGTSWSQERIHYWEGRAAEQDRLFSGIVGDVSLADSDAGQGGTVRVVAVW